MFKGELSLLLWGALPPPGLGRLHAQCNLLRLRLPLASVIMITIMITQFSKVIEYGYDYMAKVFDYKKLRLQ